MSGWVAGAIVVGGVAGAAISSDASRKAANTQADSAAAANQLQKDTFDKQVALNEPFRQGGLTAQSRLMELLGLGGDANKSDYGSLMRDFSQSDFQTDPGYQFRLQQGQQGLERSAAARGGLLSGAAIKDAMNYNQGMGSQEYANAFNRFQTNRSNKLNPLQSLMGASQTATNTIGQAAQNYGNQAGQNIIGAGNARASGYVGQANAINSGISQGVNLYQQNQLMNRLYPSGGSNYNVGNEASANFIGPLNY